MTTTRTTRRQLSRLALASLAAPVLAACGAGEDETSPSGTPDKVTVGIVPIIDVAPIYLGKERGYFSKRGIDLTLTQAQSGAAVLPGVVSGEFSFGFSNIVSLMLAQAKNTAVKAVANGVNTTGEPSHDFSGLIVKDPKIKSTKDLEGRTVATNALKNIVDTSVKEIVRKDDGDWRKIKFVEMPFADMAAALADDKIQAMFVVEPFLSAARAKGWRSLGSFADVDPKLCVALYFTSTQLAVQKPDLVHRFALAMAESLEYADSHANAARQIVTTYTKIKIEQVAAMTLPRWLTDIDRTSIETMSGVLVSTGLLAAPANMNVLLP
ncbi:ABC transporter substrate-binding protein [Hamadaea sp. NPDC051192]|uniref:ABC transporter substrate-binding protein n=1 Tax=Hamadaea sp. NPDC051192 TaxID=3154940 RepID=UPI003446B2C8